MSSLNLCVLLVALLEQDSENFDGRTEVKGVGSLPALESGNTDTRLQWIVSYCSSLALEIGR